MALYHKSKIAKQEKCKIILQGARHPGLDRDSGYMDWSTSYKEVAGHVSPRSLHYLRILLFFDLYTDVAGKAPVHFFPLYKVGWTINV